MDISDIRSMFSENTPSRLHDNNYMRGSEQDHITNRFQGKCHEDS